jgi:hypothetical protein
MGWASQGRIAPNHVPINELSVRLLELSARLLDLSTQPLHVTAQIGRLVVRVDCPLAYALGLCIHALTAACLWTHRKKNGNEVSQTTQQVCGRLVRAWRDGHACQRPPGLGAVCFSLRRSLLTRKE